MKKIGIFFLCLIMMISSASCEQNQIKLKYDTIENIYKNTEAQQILPFNKDKTPIPVRVPNVSEVYSLKLERFDYVPQIETMAKFFSDTFDPSHIEKVPNQIPQDNIYKTDTFKLAAADGGFAYWPLYDGQSKPEMFEVFNNSERVSIVKPYRGEPLSEEALPMIDGNLSMKQAGDELEVFLSEKLATVETNYTHKIRTAFTRKFNETAYCYEFFVERFYKNINFDSTIAYTLKEAEIKNHQGNVSRVGMPLYVCVFSVGGYKTWYFSTQGYNYNVSSAQKLENKFITFDSAVEILKNNISASSSFTINSAEFCYDISYPGYFDTRASNGSMDSGAKFFSEVTQYHSTPVWMFIIDHENDLEMEKKHDIHAAYMINAVTGELYIYPCTATY